MKLTKTVFALSAVMLLTACGGGKGQAGTKVEKEQFLEASANLPATHPYLGVTMKQHSEAPGEAATDKTTHFTWDGSEWVADDGYSYFQGETISYFMATSIDAITQSGYTITRLDYYIEPFAVILEAYMELGGYKIEANTKAEWNEYGLMTYAETVGKSGGYAAIERAEFTYETAPNN